MHATDREVRLIRGRARLAVAASVLEQARCDIEAAMPGVGDRLERLHRSLVRLVHEAGRELEREGAEAAQPSQSPSPVGNSS